MYVIDYKHSTDKFYIQVQGDYSQEEYKEELFLLKSMFFFYEPSVQAWSYDGFKFWDFVEYSKYLNLETSYTEEASKAIKGNKWYARETTFFRNEKFDDSILNDKVELYAHQKYFANWAVKRSSLANFDDVGAGKSIQLLANMGHLYSKGKIDSLIILVKSGLQYHWQHEILQFLNLFTEDDILIVDNKNKNKPLQKDKKIIIIGSHLWADVVCSYKYKVVPKKKSNIRFNTWSVDLNKEFGKKSIGLIIDESHDFKNAKSVKSKVLSSHKKYFPYRNIATATPSITNFEDYWFQLNFIDRAIIGMSEIAFKISIAKEIGDNYGMYNIVEYDEKKIADYKDRFKVNAIRRQKEDLPQMKTKLIVKPIFFHLSAKQQRIFDFVKELEITKIKEEDGYFNFSNIKNKFPYTLQVLDNPALLIGKFDKDDTIVQESERKKLKGLIGQWSFNNDPRIVYTDTYLKENITELGEKVVIFDTHPLTLDMLAKRYAKYNPLVIHGKIKDRTPLTDQQTVDKFNDLKSEHKLILLSTHTSSAGINLHQGGNKILSYTNTNNPIQYSQLIGRQNRINSTRDAYVTLLTFDKTYDTIRMETNRNKDKLNNEFLTRKLSIEELYKLLNGSK